LIQREPLGSAYNDCGSEEDGACKGKRLTTRRHRRSPLVSGEVANQRLGDHHRTNAPRGSPTTAVPTTDGRHRGDSPPRPALCRAKTSAWLFDLGFVGWFKLLVCIVDDSVTPLRI
jgi:hypothetical protein